MGCKIRQLNIIASRLADKKDAKGLLEVEKQLIAVIEDNKKRAIKIGSKGTNYHVTDVDWKGNVRVTDELGFHVGNRQVVEDYAAQMYGDKPKFLKDIKNKKQLKTVSVHDTSRSLGGWDLKYLTGELKAKGAIDDVVIKNYGQLQKELIRKGYDALTYVNMAEGNRDEVNSMVIINPKAVEVSNTTVLDADEMVFGSDEEVFRMGDNYPGAEKAYWKLQAVNRERNDSVMDNAKGSLVTVTDTNTNTFKQKRVADAQVGLGRLTVEFTDGTSVNVDPVNGFDLYSGNQLDMTVFSGIVYGSDGTSGRVKWDEFDRLEKEVHGNVAAMQDLVDELADMDKSSTSEEVEYLKNVIGMIDQKHYGKIQTFIKRKARQAGGIHQGKRIGIIATSNKKATNSSKSNAEVYVHELIHAVTVFALKQNDPGTRKLRRQIEYVMQDALEALTPQSFVDTSAPNQELEKAESEALFKYMFESENALEEFIALAVTNPRVIKKLQAIRVKEKDKARNVFEKITQLLGTLIDLVMGNYKFKDGSKNAHEQMMDLVVDLAKINNDAINSVKMGSKAKVAHRSLGDMLNIADEKVSYRLQNLFDKYLSNEGTIPPPPKGKAAYSIWMGKALAKMFTHTEYRKQFELMLSAWGFQPEGDLQTIMRDFKEGDELSKIADWLALASDKIDQSRSTIDSVTKKSIHDAFENKLSSEQEIAMTRVLVDTDLEGVYNKYSRAKIREWLKDGSKLRTKVGRLKHQLKLVDEKNYNWHSAQATGLGYYMATHKAGLVQNFNAEAIADGTMSSFRKKADPKVVELVDEIATLVALEHTDSLQKLQVEELMRVESDGVANIINRHRAFKKDAKKVLFKETGAQMIKGYSKEVFDDSVTMEIAPLANQEEMEARGMMLKKELIANEHNKYGKKMGMYVSNMFETSNWYRGVTRLTRLGTKGTSIDASLIGETYGKQKARIMKLQLDTDRIRLAKKMEEGEFDPADTQHGLVPLLDQYGSVVNYRHMMDKESKEDFLGQNAKVSDVLGRSFASSVDKASTTEHNKKALDLILKDMKENYTGGLLGKNGRPYVVISENSTDKKLKELYSILPKEFKQAASRTMGKGLAVRRDLLHVYFGFRHLSIVDFPLVGKITPQVFHGFIKVAETIWEEAIKIVKTGILLKMPAVITLNIVSNALYAVMTGSDPFKLIGAYKESIRDARAYITKHRELVKLELDRRAGTKDKKIDARITKLQRELKDNPVHELSELGLYQAIVEDISNAELTSTNKLKQIINDKTSRVPSVVKTGMNWLYLTEETSYYKFMSEVLQISDLVARDVENRKLKLWEEAQANGKRVIPRWFAKEKGWDIEKPFKKKLSGADRIKFLEGAKERRHEVLLNSFVNYNKPPGRVENYLNRMGAIMFTTYAKRIQRVIGTTALEHPIKSLLMLLGQEFVLDVETIQDQALLTRSWYNVGLSAGDSVPFTNPLERVMDLVTPALVKSSTYKFY